MSVFNSLLGLTARINTSSVAWISILNSTSANIGHGIAMDSSTNLYIGSTNSVAPYVVKYNSSGTLQWQGQLSGGMLTSGKFNSIVVDSLANAYVVGDVIVSSMLQQGLIVKYDSSGTLQWQRTLSSGVASIAFDASAIDSSANIYVVGNSHTTGTVALIVKYDSSGTLQWQRTLTAAAYAVFSSVCCDSSGNVYAAGVTTVSGNDAFLIVKYDSSGTLQWQRTLSIANGCDAYGIVSDSSNVYVVGTINGTSGGNNGLITKYNSSGTLQWQRNIGPGVSLQGYVPQAVTIDSSSNIYITGWYYNSSLYEIPILKYNSSGVIQWQQILYASSGVNEMFSIVGDSLGNLFCTGQTTSVGSGQQNIMTFKLKNVNVNGTIQPFVFASSSLSEIAATGTSSVSSLSSTPSSFTDTASSFSTVAATLTATMLT